MSDVEQEIRTSRILKGAMKGVAAYLAIVVASAIAISLMPRLYETATLVEGGPNGDLDDFRVSELTLDRLVEELNLQDRWDVSQAEAKKEVREGLKLRKGDRGTTEVFFRHGHPTDCYDVVRQWCRSTMSWETEMKINNGEISEEELLEAQKVAERLVYLENQWAEMSPSVRDEAEEIRLDLLEKKKKMEQIEAEEILKRGMEHGEMERPMSAVSPDVTSLMRWTHLVGIFVFLLVTFLSTRGVNDPISMEEIRVVEKKVEDFRNPDY